MATSISAMYLKILSNLSGLELAESDTNAAGIVRLRLLPANLVEQVLVPPWNAAEEAYEEPWLVNGDSILLLPDAAFVDLAVMPEYASFSDDMGSEANGIYYRPTIQIILPKERPGVVAWCHRYGGRHRWVALLQDRNGMNRLVGTERQPLELSVTATSGAGKAGRNARTLTFAGLTQDPALFVDAIDDAVLFPKGAFDDTFGFPYQT